MNNEEILLLCNLVICVKIYVKSFSLIWKSWKSYLLIIIEFIYTQTFFFKLHIWD